MTNCSGVQNEPGPSGTTDCQGTQMVLEKAFELFEDLCDEGLIAESWTWVKGIERFIATVCDGNGTTAKIHLDLLCRAYERCWSLRVKSWGSHFLSEQDA